MSTLRFSLRLGMALWFGFGAGTLWAQAEGVVIRLVPQPNQTVKFRMTDEGNSERTSPRATPAGAKDARSLKLAHKTILICTETTGAPDGQGFVEAEITCEVSSNEVTLNGEPALFNDNNFSSNVKTFKITYNRQGQIVKKTVPRLESDWKAPLLPGLARLYNLKSQIGEDFDKLSAQPLRPGDTLRVPTRGPISVSSGPDAGPTRREGQTIYKLVALEKEGADRVALLDISRASQGVRVLDPSASPLGPTQANVAAELKWTETVRMAVNLDKGLIKTFEATGTTDEKITVAKEPGFDELDNIADSVSHSITKTTITTSY